MANWTNLRPPLGLYLRSGSFAEPFRVEIYDHARNDVREEGWMWEEWQEQLPVRVRIGVSFVRSWSTEDRRNRVYLMTARFGLLWAMRLEEMGNWRTYLGNMLGRRLIVYVMDGPGKVQKDGGRKGKDLSH